MSEIALSVVIAAQGSEGEALECVRSLAGGERKDVEIIVVAGNELPSMREPVLVVRAESRSLPRMLGLGAAVARGHHVALCEACFRFAPGWLTEATQAIHERPDAVIGGCVDPAESLGYIDRAMVLCDYGQFSSPWREGSVRELPGSNVILPRDLLPSARDLESAGLWKTFLCERLVAEQGVALVAWPALRVIDKRRLGLGDWIARRARHGRCWGAMRIGQAAMVRRVAHAIGVPVIALLVAGRTWRKLRAAGMKPSTILVHAPAILPAIAIWIVGEWLGNLFGPGRACERL